MGCSNCKEKKKLKEDIYTSTDKLDKKLFWFIIMWSGFAIYGIISFVKLFI